jgi:hypothetical protein
MGLLAFSRTPFFKRMDDIALTVLSQTRVAPQ